MVVNRKYQQYSTCQRQVESKEERLRGLANHQFECDSVSQEMTPGDQVRRGVPTRLMKGLSVKILRTSADNKGGRQRKFRKSLSEYSFSALRFFLLHNCFLSIYDVQHRTSY